MLENIYQSRKTKCSPTFEFHGISWYLEVSGWCIWGDDYFDEGFDFKLCRSDTNSDSESLPRELFYDIGVLWFGQNPIKVMSSSIKFDGTSEPEFGFVNMKFLENTFLRFINDDGSFGVQVRISKKELEEKKNDKDDNKNHVANTENSQNSELQLSQDKLEQLRLK